MFAGVSSYYDLNSHNSSTRFLGNKSRRLLPVTGTSPFLFFCLGVAGIVFYFLSAALVSALAAQLIAILGSLCVFASVCYLYLVTDELGVVVCSLKRVTAVLSLGLGLLALNIYFLFPGLVPVAALMQIIGYAGFMLVFVSIAIFLSNKQAAAIRAKLCIIGILLLGMAATAFYTLSASTFASALVSQVMGYAGLSLIACALLGFCLKAGISPDAKGAWAVLRVRCRIQACHDMA